MKTKTPYIDGDDYLAYEELDMEWEDKDVFSLNPDTDIELLCEISMNQKLSVKEIDKLVSLTKHELNKKWILKLILLYQETAPSLYLLNIYKDELDFDILLSKSNNPNAFFEKYKDNIDLERAIWKYDFNPDIEFIREFNNEFFNASCWEYISKWGNGQIIEEFKDKLNWNVVSKDNLYYIYNDLYHYIDYINWDIISEHKLPKNFIVDFNNKLNATKLFWNNFNDEEIMKLIEDRINWTIISSEPLSEEIIEKYKDKLDWDLLYNNKNIPEDLLKIIHKNI